MLLSMMHGANHLLHGLHRWLYRRHKDQRISMQMVQQEQYNEDLAQY